MLQLRHNAFVEEYGDEWVEKTRKRLFSAHASALFPNPQFPTTSEARVLLNDSAAAMHLTDIDAVEIITGVRLAHDMLPLRDMDMFTVYYLREVLHTMLFIASRRGTQGMFPTALYWRTRVNELTERYKEWTTDYETDLLPDPDVVVSRDRLDAIVPALLSAVILDAQKEISPDNDLFVAIFANVLRMRDQLEDMDIRVAAVMQDCLKHVHTFINSRRSHVSGLELASAVRSSLQYHEMRKHARVLTRTIDTLCENLHSAVLRLSMDIRDMREVIDSGVWFLPVEELKDFFVGLPIPFLSPTIVMMTPQAVYEYLYQCVSAIVVLQKMFESAGGEHVASIAQETLNITRQTAEIALRTMEVRMRVLMSALAGHDCITRDFCDPLLVEYHESRHDGLVVDETTRLGTLVRTIEQRIVSSEDDSPTQPTGGTQYEVASDYRRAEVSPVLISDTDEESVITADVDEVMDMYDDEELSGVSASFSDEESLIPSPSPKRWIPQTQTQTQRSSRRRLISVPTQIGTWDDKL